MKQETGCIDCVHHDSQLGEFENGKFNLTYRCKKGNDVECKKWWADNAKKTRGNLSAMPCFEETEFSQFLNKMSNTIDEISALVGKVAESNKP